ncbi:MAG: prolyl oligopeptidase family serine peptidase [Cytophagales bacterium]|nr:prolyl oligopeptidase family serine peptidase [Cytophagales bacterium]MCA6383579.1 prolyl oligopeptidase family serine peptidase [Cytophagales bacterium]
MNRNLYFIENFFLGLTIASGLFQSIVYLQLGSQLLFMKSFMLWFLVSNVVSLSASIMILKYYRDKKYQFAFSTGTIAVITLFSHFTITSIVLLTRQLESLYIFSLFISQITGIVYAIALIFSNTGKRVWLKAAGVAVFIMGVFFLSTYILSITSNDVQLKLKLETIIQWATLIGSLIPSLFIMNFFNETRTLMEVDSTSAQKSTENTLSLVGIILFLLTLFFGGSLAIETMSKVSWEKHLSVMKNEWAKLFEARTYEGTKEDTLHYQLLKPIDYDSKTKYPLVVCLPYGGGVEGSPPAQFLLQDSIRRKYPSFLFIPVCPNGAGWGGIPNYPTIDTLVFDALHALEEQYEAIDTKRLYITGVSRGGYGSWHFICMRPELFAAAIPICGGEDPVLAKGIVNVPVWAFHGEDDRNVPVKSSRDMIEAIQKAGGNPRYTEFPDTGHDIWDKVKETSGLLDWLFAQKRD